MNFLLSLLAGGEAYFNVGFGFMVIAATCFACALIPPFLDVIRTNKTFGLSTSFIVSAFSAAFLFVLMAFIFFVTKHSSAAATEIAGYVIMLLTNSSSFAVNLFIYFKKKANMEMAKSLNLSEIDYYFQHVLPAMEAKTVAEAPKAE